MHECEQDRRKSDTLPGAGCEEYCINCEVSEATALLPSRLPGSAGISKGFTPGICLSGIPTRHFSQPKQTNEEKKDSQTMPHAQHMQGQKAHHDQQVCENEGGGLWVVLVMTRWLVLAFPFPSLRTALRPRSDRMSWRSVTARAPQVSMFPSATAVTCVPTLFVSMAVSM
jgi:hypothetical protein